MSVERMKTDAILQAAVLEQLKGTGLPVLGVEIFDAGSAVGAAFEVPAAVGGLSGLKGRHAFLTREIDPTLAVVNLRGQYQAFLAEREKEPFPEAKIAC